MPTPTPMRGEIGTIYQACNWVHIGKDASTRQWLAPNGRVYDQKLPSNLKKQKGAARQDWVKALKAAGWYEQASNPKHRSVQMLDRKDEAPVERIKAMRQPYPERERDEAEAE